MAENTEVVQTPEELAAQAAILANGRTADLDAAAKKMAAERLKPDDEDQKAIDAENAAKALADTKAKETEAEEAAKKAEAEKLEKNDDGTWKGEYVQTGNEHADAAIELMKEAGVKPVEANDIFKAAIESGDLSKVKWDILESRIGKSKAALVKAGVESYYAGEYKTQTETKEAAHEIVGGEENWTKLRAWVQAKEKGDSAFAAKADNARKAILIGGDAAKAAVANLKTLYEADPKNSGLGTKKVLENKGGTAPTANADGEPMTQAEYYKAMKASHKAREPDSARQAFWARRQAGVAKGI